MTKSSLAVFFLATLTLVAACRRGGEAGPPKRTEPMVLGGRPVSAEALEHGREIYTHYCRACHGDQGDGKGTAAAGLVPPPRDLRLGMYKFGGVAAGELPTDADFVRIIRGGLHGTAMQAWDVPYAEAVDLIQYVKAFSPRWQKEKAGDPIPETPDPWAGKEAAGVERGKRVYHGLAQCAVACHPAYATRAEIFADTKALTQMRLGELRPDLYDAVAKDSDYGFKIVPPDFTFNLVRAGDKPADLYRTIAAGIGGTAMPTWKNVLPEADLWAMAHYVRSLIALRGTPAAAQLRKSLLEQPYWVPPSADAGAEDGNATTP